MYKRQTPPFVITAIGDATNMENSLKMRGGVVDNLKVWGIQVNIKKQAQITIPAYSGGLSFEYAQLAGEEEGSQWKKDLWMFIFTQPCLW